MVPLTDTDAGLMITSVRGYDYLQDHRVDVEALRELILRISFLAEELPLIEKMTVYATLHSQIADQHSTIKLCV
jgi:hypothetical protein